MKNHVVRTALVFLGCTLLGSSLASAQASRTWVSGVGDDANPCSRTAPCKTFAGAISKTAAGGEISVLDPGGYGAVTITKSMTISGYGEHASILAAGTNGININGAGVVVQLKHLQLDGLGTGLVGICALLAAVLVVDDVSIWGFQTGIQVESGNALIDHALVTSNSVFGVNALGTSSVTVENSMFMNNGTALQAGGTSRLRLANNGIYNNLLGFGCGGGTLASAGNNRKGGNGAGGGPACAPTEVVVLQ